MILKRISIFSQKVGNPAKVGKIASLNYDSSNLNLIKKVCIRH